MSTKAPEFPNPLWDAEDVKEWENKRRAKRPPPKKTCLITLHLKADGASVRERMATMTYTATITREGRNWLATVTNLDGVSTWAHSFSGLDTNVREAIALAEDLPEGAKDSIIIEWSIPDATPAS